MNGASVRAVEAELVPHFDVIEHNPQLIEVVPKGYTKATGIAQVCDMLGVARENTYAFGDSTNDLEMLTYVGHGIAMGNGASAAKAAAEYVTTDIMNHGIKNGLKHYGLIG